MRFAALAVSLFLLVSCAPAMVSGDDNSLHVLATLEIFASIAERIGGDYVRADYMVPQGSDIHDYSLTPDDVGKIRNADLILLAGSEYFSIDSKILENVEDQSVLDFDDYNATLLPLGSMEKNYHGYWLYPNNAVGIARAIYKRLSSLDPAHAPYYLARYTGFLSEVNGSMVEALKLVKESGLQGAGVLLAVPGTFYVARALGFEVKGVLLEGPNQFASQADLQRYSQEIQDGRIKMVVNAQNLENSKAGEMAKELSRMTGVRVVYVDIFSAQNYTFLLLKNAAVLSSTMSVSTYRQESCDILPYLYTIISLVAVLSIVTYLAYTYRRELLR